MPTALILGVVSAQADLIEYLADEGWHVIGAAHRERGAGLAYVDRFELVDIVDTGAVERLARETDVDLVHSTGSDLGIETATEVSERLGLPRFLDPETVDMIDRKPRFRDFLRREGLSPVAYRRVTSASDLSGWETYPAVLKPADSYGARGVAVVESEAEARQQLPTALEHARNDTALVEEYLDGFEISVNVFLVDGSVRVAILSDRLVAERDRVGITGGHVVPSSCTAEETEAVIDLVERTVAALPAQDGPLYFQLKMTDRGPRIVELAPRLDGCHLWRLIDHACDIDLLEMTVDQLVGDTPAVADRSGVEPHRLEYLLGPANEPFRRVAYDLPEDAVYSEFYYEDGDTIRATNGTEERVGYSIVSRGA
jgi:phosphoribosylamine-glycine ligase